MNSAAKRIALLEDDPAQSELLKTWLQAAGHYCQTFNKGRSLLSELTRESYDLIIVDWNLPDIGGDAVLTWIRKRLDWPVPVLFVTSRETEEDIVHALESGADDYLTKPARQMELLARITALTRRSSRSMQPQEALNFGIFRIDTVSRIISRGNERIDLTDKEYDLALFLFQNVGRLLSRGHILETVWARNPDLDTRTVDVHISRIRRKLQLAPENGWRLTAVYQHGYRLEPVGININNDRAGL